MRDKKLETKMEYYDNGIIKSVYSVDENGNKQGPYESYYNNGQLEIRCTYKNDQKDGPLEVYHDNGQLNEKCTFKNGKEHGSLIWYNRYGGLYWKGFYKDGKWDGLIEMYHDNGQLKKRATYKDGEADGLYETYHSDGSLDVRCVFKMGERLTDQEAEKYLEEKRMAITKTDRKSLNDRLAQMDRQMAPTQLRQNAKRAEVAKFRARYLKQDNCR